MPKNSAKATVGNQPEASTETRWSRIGINAVAAASICKSHGKHDRKDERSSKITFPFAETDYATD